MSGKRFEKITASLKYTDVPRPSYVDRVHEVRRLLASFNELMNQIFNAGWVVCLDESKSPWTNMRTCAAFVFCPSKPHPKGNEYHTIDDGLSGILFGLELVEGKDGAVEIEKDCRPPVAALRAAIWYNESGCVGLWILCLKSAH